METENIGSLLPVARLGNLAISACRKLRVKWRAMPQCWKVTAVYFSPLVSSLCEKANNPILSGPTCPLEDFYAKIENSYQTFIESFNCCPSVHVDNHTIIIPTKCTLLLLKASDITICTLCHYILPLPVSTRVGHLQGAQCQCLAKVIINYNLLKLC
jgi:hypothetical protein